MTAGERAAIRARAEAASPGPWCAGYRDDGPNRILRTDGNGHSASTAKSNYRRIVMTEANRFFIAHARTDIPDLLDSLDAADRRIAELEALVRNLSERVYKQSELLSRRAEGGKPTDRIGP